MQVQPTSFVRNAFLNFLGQLVPAVIGAAAVPFFLRGLGTERFGVLSLGWLILSYFTMFDLGLGRATAKYLSQALVDGTGKQIRQLVWTAMTIQALLGFLGAFLIVVLTPALVGQVFKISPQLVGEARISFYLLAVAVPAALLSGPVSGVLEAKQRFDVLNAVRVLSGALIALFPLAGLLFSLSLPGVVALLVLARLAAFGMLAAVTLRAAPEVKRYALCLSLLPRLLSFGSWVMVSNLAWPLLFYLDRFLISWLVGIKEFAYYQIAHQVINVTQFAAAGVAGAMFPAVSRAEAKGSREDIGRLYRHSLKTVGLIMTPVYCALAALSESILGLWIGGGETKRAADALRVLAAGGLAVSVLQVPYTLLHAVGRADVTAKMYLIQVLSYPALLWLLIAKWGLVGASAGWSARAWVFGTALLLRCREVLHEGRDLASAHTGIAEAVTRGGDAGRARGTGSASGR
ncbi:MAG: flippase [Candidatus Methanomethylicaceae archaeon]